MKPNPYLTRNKKKWIIYNKTKKRIIYKFRNKATAITMLPKLKHLYFPDEVEVLPLEQKT